MTIRPVATTHRRLATPCLAVGLAFVLLVLFCVGAQAGPAPTPAYAGPTLVPASGPVITIGLAAPLSGGLGWLGQLQLNGVQLAISETNAAGGVQVGGVTYTLRLVTGDDECSPVNAPSVATQLLADGAVAVVGHTCSGASLAADDIYNAAGVAMVSPSSTSPNVTEEGYTTTSRVISRDDQPPAQLAEYCRNYLGMEKAAILATAGPWSSPVEAISATFTGLGGQVTSLRMLDWSGDYTATVSAVAAEAPDVVFYCEGTTDHIALLRQVADTLGLDGVPLGWATFTDDEGVLDAYAAQAGEAAEGDYACMYYRRPQDMPGFDRLKQSYQAAYGGEPTAMTAYAYDAARIISDALARAANPTRAAVRNAIASTSNYQGVVGTYEGFDGKGDVIPQWGWLEQRTAQRWVVLRPGELTIGVGAPLSGPLDSAGWPAANAVRLVAEEANAAGGVCVNGVTYTLHVAAADSACDPAQASDAAEVLLHEGAVAVVGHVCSVESLAAQPTYHGAGVAMVSPSSTNPQLTEGGYTTTFRVVARDDRPPALLASYVANWLYPRRAAIIGFAGSWAEPAASEAIRNAFTGLGRVVTSYRLIGGTGDLTGTVEAIRAEGPTVVLYTDLDPARAARFRLLLDSHGMAGVPLAWGLPQDDGDAADLYAALAGPRAEGDLLCVFHRRVHDMPGYPTLLADYRGACFPYYGDEPGMVGACAYDAAGIVVEAMGRAASAEPAAIRDAIASMHDYDGVVGTYQGFDEKGDVIPQWAWLARLRQGKWAPAQANKAFLPLAAHG